MDGGEGLRLRHVTGRRGAKRRTRRRPPPGASPAAPCLSLPASAFPSSFLFFSFLSFPFLFFLFASRFFSFIPSYPVPLFLRFFPHLLLLLLLVLFLFLVLFHLPVLLSLCHSFSPIPRSLRRHLQPPARSTRHVKLCSFVCDPPDSFSSSPLVLN